MIFDVKLVGFLVMEGGYAISRTHFVDFKVAYSFQLLTNSRLRGQIFRTDDKTS